MAVARPPVSDGRELRRRLAAVMALDAAGYSRLMGADEEGTHRRLTTILGDRVVPLIEEWGGRVFKHTGDGALVEFASAVDATGCAIAIQHMMPAHEQGNPEDKRILFRIGINLGDVIVEPEELYGDGVNIAVRLEALAEPGGILVSQLVADQVGDKRNIKFVDLGRKRLKNIQRPIRVYRVEIPEQPPAAETAARRIPAAAARNFVDRPAIAVLPFVNLGGDPAEEYFADGLTEDVITGLARLRAFPVIARNSTFVYKGKHVDARAVGQELGARYVLEGSVRRAGPRARVVAQLVEAQSNAHLFADQFDRELTDLFAVQDEITTSIVGEIEPELLRSERERVARLPPRNFDAYDCLQRGLWHHYRYTRDDSLKAVQWYLKSVEIDPNYSAPCAAMSLTLVNAIWSGWIEGGTPSLKDALRYAENAVHLDTRDPQAHFALAVASYHSGKVPQGLSEIKEALRLNPSHAAAYANHAFLLNYVNRPLESLQSVATAFRLSPHDTRRFIWFPALAGAHYLAGQFDKAVETGLEGLRLNPDYLHSVPYIMAALGRLGRQSEAETYLPLLRRMDNCLGDTETRLGRLYVDHAALQNILEGLRAAGFV
ncbi:MAG TPA: adenylate/guanylate cyclase domain-containing protein [Alphaproteobacteria bacterium]|nr:adenylate/guanylate cyclase domain-containing protein [Alphaproteobacteria bacterium]